jgi:hypothetical protein
VSWLLRPVNRDISLNQAGEFDSKNGRLGNIENGRDTKPVMGPDRLVVYVSEGASAVHRIWKGSWRSVANLQWRTNITRARPVDLSQKRLCEVRCLALLDDMNNWTGPKYIIAEADTYMKYPDDETFLHLVVNCVKLDRVPNFDDGWSPLLSAMRAGGYFVNSGEVPLRNRNSASRSTPPARNGFVSHFGIRPGMAPSRSPSI